MTKISPCFFLNNKNIIIVIIVITDYVRYTTITTNLALKTKRAQDTSDMSPAPVSIFPLLYTKYTLCRLLHHHLSPKVENIVQEIQNPVCVNSRNSRNYLENIHILGIPGIFWEFSGISGFLGNQWRSEKYWDSGMVGWTRVISFFIFEANIINLINCSNDISGCSSFNARIFCMFKLPIVTV